MIAAWNIATRLLTNSRIDNIILDVFDCSLELGKGCLHTVIIESVRFVFSKPAPKEREREARIDAESEVDKFYDATSSGR